MSDAHKMRPALRFFALTLAMILGGCGLNTMQSEQYTLKGAMSEVMASVKERSEVIDTIAATLSDARLADADAVTSWKAAKEAVASVRDRFWVDDGNQTVSELNARIVRLEQAADRIAEAGNRESSNQRLGASETAQLRSAVVRDRALAAGIATAKTKYNVQVQSYNEVISIAPVKWAAAILGEKQRVGFAAIEHDASGATKAPGKTERLVEAAIGASVRRNP